MAPKLTNGNGVGHAANSQGSNSSGTPLPSAPSSGLQRATRLKASTSTPQFNMHATADETAQGSPELARQIENARSTLEVPTSKRGHRLSAGAKDAAALRAALYGTMDSVFGAEPKEEAKKPAVATWSPSSWVSKPIVQDVVYNDRQKVEVALEKLERLPPIVTPAEICKLKNNLREVALGKAFLLQGGDCAELFDYCEASSIDSKIKLLLQMSMVLIWGANKKVIRIARMGGQYAKPRSKPTEMHEGKEIHAFRGDILNGYNTEERVPDPDRLVQAYFHSAATLNYVRAQLASGIADLHDPLNWDLGYVKDKELLTKYEKIVNSIKESLDFMHTVGADTAKSLETVDLFMSHEGLVLEYEQCLTRRLKHPPNYMPPSSTSAVEGSSDGAGWYNCATHFIWIGDRTRQINGAHVEYFRGLENPIGIKCGPSMKPDELIELLDIVNPNKEIGKVTLITRYGQDKVDDLLPKHIEAVKKSGHVVVWQSDPMHGNTWATPTGIKTRSFSAILKEVSSALRIHQEHGSFLGGVHLELTGDAVTECVGGSEGLVEEDLNLKYMTFCDPRLNEKQALEMAFLVAGHHREKLGKST